MADEPAEHSGLHDEFSHLRRFIGSRRLGQRGVRRLGLAGDPSPETAAAYPVSPWNTLASPNVPQPDIIDVASSAGFTAGDTIEIDPGTANQETDTVASVATVR